MIPKTIHYCWFGNNPKSDEILDCIESWKRTCPDFELKEWNELTFPFETFPFASRMYNEKKWAFVADYARLKILEEEGGFYLDTDMLLVKPLTPLLDKNLVIGEESAGILNAAILGAVPHHPFIARCIEYYNTHPDNTQTIPRVISEVYRGYSDTTDISVYPQKVFYPFTVDTIKEYKGQDVGPDTIGIHLWHYSWGHPLNKLFKRLGIHRIGIRIAEALGIKSFLKKLLGFV
jgi:mannosyltransferase OCH1-like enzyme